MATGPYRKVTLKTLSTLLSEGWEVESDLLGNQTLSKEGESQKISDFTKLGTQLEGREADLYDPSIIDTIDESHDVAFESVAPLDSGNDMRVVFFSNNYVYIDYLANSFTLTNNDAAVFKLVFNTWIN